MPVMSDEWIIRMCKERRMIEPFSVDQIRQGISYGVSSYGYDISLSDEFWVPRMDGLAELDPQQDNSEYFDQVSGEYVLIPPASFVLAKSQEYFRIPRQVITICPGKSTYARNGVIVNVTPFEPEWEGFATISISNTAPVPVRVYAQQGIAQLLFLQANEPCQTSYQDKKGKYQAQRGITVSRSD